MPPFQPLADATRMTPGRGSKSAAPARGFTRDRPTEVTSPDRQCHAVVIPVQCVGSGTGASTKSLHQRGYQRLTAHRALGGCPERLRRTSHDAAALINVLWPARRLEIGRRSCLEY